MIFTIRIITMEISLTTLLIVLALSAVTGNPIWRNTPQYLQFKFPQLNTQLVEFCYFNETEWKDNLEPDKASWCKLVIAPSTEDLNRYPEELLKPLNELYLRYVALGTKDQTNILACVVRNRHEESTKLASCARITEDLEWNAARRQSRAAKYFDLLSGVSAQLDVCHRQINFHSQMEQHCSDELLDAITIVEHCALYHSSRLMLEFDPCKQVFEVSKLPNDLNSIAIYLELADMKSKIADNYWPFTRKVSKYKAQFRNVLNYCYNTNDWFDNPLDRCHNITSPSGDGNLSNKRLLKLQVEWQRVTRDLLKEDCTMYHRYQTDDEYSSCSIFANEME